MVGGARRGARARRLRPAHQVAAPPQPPPPVATLPKIDASLPEALVEMRRVVRERFPNRSKWPDIFMENLRHATFEERAHFAGDDGGMDYEFIFWVIQEAESSDPRQAARWARFKTAHRQGPPSALRRCCRSPASLQKRFRRGSSSPGSLEASAIRRMGLAGCPRPANKAQEDQGIHLGTPPWSGDRGEKPRTKGRKWRSVKCILAKLSCFLHQWKVLCDDGQANLLQRCILLLDKRRGELLWIAWR
ncbi:uncharacterized protein [Triticum aestivum]|uniref:uncharacterized protein isoform X1 n=1 Tax=Triticum aestivum TaxID=4565 RepID=UPI001D02441B|nr:uncharacterized protein LOC123100161 isoform X1 [Triticum aestivum]